MNSLKLMEGRVHGARYHCVEPIGATLGSCREMEDWCVRHFGEVSSVWQADKWLLEPAQRWYMNNSTFFFRNEADRTMFVLRWQ